MMALRHAEATGEGQVIDLSLFEPIFAILEPQMANYAMSGVPKPRTGSRSTNTAPRNAYRTRDGKWVGLSSSTQSVFERLMRSIGQEALLADPRFATNSDRLRHIEAIDQVVRDAVAAMTLEEALAQFDRDGVTIGPILDVADLARDAYVREREALIAVPDEEMPGGLLPMHGQVPRLSRTPGLLRNPAPRLGEDTRRLLAAALGEAEAERLIEAGVAIACRR
jgi:formyl-CoA transferase